ncbi:hypothetical protein [Treponema sp.]|uniref:hypothetical protein n=1 Tax=Treponema sp. TaxID=166 RepID=UPI00298DF7D8|nr:hypothetical protein [Treponema sp.]MCQ2240396.1 hypothetical protein [Treponema sp.]
MKNYGDRKLTSFSVMRAYANVILGIRGLFFLLPYLGTVIWKFFLLQYLQKIHLRRIEITSVDHELDTTVPFREDYAGIYLDFINYWIRPLSMMFKKFGHMKGLKLCAEWFRRISLAYNEAYKVYSKNLTTTRRPSPKTKAVRNIQKADPHYCCVPSLHIAVIVLTISFYRMLLAREDFTEDERKNFNEEIYSHGVEIAESVLYMKQHSVNCIPAALYMVTKIAPDIMTVEIAEELIKDLFAKAEDVTEENKEKIKAHIQKFYHELLSESELFGHWSVPVLNWIKNYTAYTE